MLFQLLQRLSIFENPGKSPMLVPEEIAEESASVAASAVITDNDENSRKRRRPFTKDKSVGTGPCQPSVNKAVQVIQQFSSDLLITSPCTCSPSTIV